MSLQLEDVPKRSAPTTTEQGVLAVIFGQPIGSFIPNLVLLNFILFFARPQDSIAALGAIRLPLLCIVLTALIWITKHKGSWTRQTKLMAIFLVVEAGRIFVGKTLFDDLVRNDNWAYLTWSDLLLQYVGLVFPLVTFFGSGPLLHRFTRVWCLVGGYLGAYVTTHGGRGPGSFLGDENDAGLVLLMFLSLSMALLAEGRLSLRERLVTLLTSGAMLAGVLATFSRGTFVGLVCVAVYLFLRSSRKFSLLLFGGILTLATISFAPAGYIAEMRTISEVQEGTAMQRRDFWTVATRVWLDPKHFLIGVGMSNVPFYLADYETVRETGEGPSMGGRAVHSIYFQLLPDLGLWGIFVVGSLLSISFRRNRQILAEMKNLQGPLNARAPSSSLVPGSINREVDLLRPFLVGINGAFIGVMSAGTFISALYYPPIWLLAGLSGLISRYWIGLYQTTQSYLTELDSNPLHQPLRDKSQEEF